MVTQTTEQSKDSTTMLTRREASLAILGALTLSGCESSPSPQEKLEAGIQVDPPQGKVAYTVGNEIRLREMNEVLSPNGGLVAKFQVSGEPRNLLWLNDREIVFSTEPPQPPQEIIDVLTELAREGAKQGASMSGTFSSHIVQVLDIETGDVRTLVDPYAKDFVGEKLFGDVAANEVQAIELLLNVMQDNAKKSWYESKVGGGRIRPGFAVTEIGRSASSSDIFLKVDDKWHALSADGAQLSLAGRIPDDLQTEQLSDGTGKYQMDQRNVTIRGLFPKKAYLTSEGSSASVNFEEGSASPAWRVKG